MPGIGIITNVVAILLGGLLGLGRTLSGRARAHHNTCGTREPQLHRQHPHLLHRHEPPRSAAHPRLELPPRPRHCRPLAGGMKTL